MSLKPRKTSFDTGYPSYEAGRTTRRNLLRLLAAGGATLAAGQLLGCGEEACPTPDPDDDSMRLGGVAPLPYPPPGAGDAGQRTGTDATTHTGQTTTTDTGAHSSPASATQNAVQGAGQATSSGSALRPGPQPEATQQSNSAMKQVR